MRQGGVLALIQNDDGLVERAAAHISQGHDFDDVVFHVAFDLLRFQHVIEGVEERPQVWVDLGDDVAGQETEPLAGFDRRADQNDAFHLSLTQKIYGHADGQKRLAGPGGSDAKRQVVFLHGSHIARLAVGAGPNMPAAVHRRQILHALPVVSMLDHVQHGANFLGRKPALMAKQVAQLLENPLGLTDTELISFDMKLISARDQANAQHVSNGAQILIAAAEQQQSLVSIIQVYGHFAHRLNQLNRNVGLRLTSGR